ncbi:MAG: acyltransferase domain-containing protein, partial [Candidatus Hydrogenedentota bacterium]
MSEWFFLFPGQGSQTPGMGKDFYENSTPAREALDEAESVLGPGFLEKLFDGTAEDLRDTRVAQTALVSVGVAISRHLAASGVAPAGCAGHSVGEIAALVVAGSISFIDGLKLTRERARLMAE